MSAGTREVRARYDDQTLTVYQAYPPAIAVPALEAGTFTGAFKRDRMTWIKPSLNWMMYRSGWATKPGQEQVLAIRITRAGFEAALHQACLSHFEPGVHASTEQWRASLATAPVRVQWDPERDLRLEPLPWRAIQVGLSGPAVRDYVEDWIVHLEDVTGLVRQVRTLVEGGDLEAARSLVPIETEYPVPAPIRERLGM